MINYRWQLKECEKLNKAKKQALPRICAYRDWIAWGSCSGKVSVVKTKYSGFFNLCKAHAKKEREFAKSDPWKDSDWFLP